MEKNKNSEFFFLNFSNHTKLGTLLIKAFNHFLLVISCKPIMTVEKAGCPLFEWVLGSYPMFLILISLCTQSSKTNTGMLCRGQSFSFYLNCCTARRRASSRGAAYTICMLFDVRYVCKSNDI